MSIVHHTHPSNVLRRHKTNKWFLHCIPYLTLPHFDVQCSSHPSTDTLKHLHISTSLSILLSHSFFGDLIIVLCIGNILTSRYTTETINAILVPGTQPKQDPSPCLKPTSTRNISDPARRRLTSSLTLFLECEVQVSFPGLPLLILLVGRLARSPLARLPLLLEL